VRFRQRSSASAANPDHNSHEHSEGAAECQSGAVAQDGEPICESARAARLSQPSGPGKGWPLTVEAGVVSCQDGSVLFMDPIGVQYAVNGLAMTQHSELARIDEIWAHRKDDPALRIDISPVLDRGLDLC
jgi:hypothetical protein